MHLNFTCVCLPAQPHFHNRPLSAETRRGARPGGVPSVEITRTFEVEDRRSEALALAADAAGSSSGSGSGSSGGGSPAGLSARALFPPAGAAGQPQLVIPEAAVSRQILTNRQAAWRLVDQQQADADIGGASSSPSSPAAAAVGQPVAGHELDQALQMISHATASDSAGAESDWEEIDEPGLSLAELQALEAYTPAAGRSGSRAVTAGGSSGDPESEAALAAARFERVDAKLGPFGSGLVERLVALEDLGERGVGDWF